MSNPHSPKSASAGSPATDAAGEPILVAAAPQNDNDEDTDSSLGDDYSLSTDSVSSSILEYRMIHGRRFHSEKYAEAYFGSNDDQHQESLDIAHHYFQLLLDGDLFLAPVPKTVKKVVDIGTGTGIWAIEFADLYPAAEIIGTDLAPMQPHWIPPNLRFEIDDAALPWTWANDSFDFVHMRCLIGSIADWHALMRQAFRCMAPGGLLESCELDVHYKSDDNTLDPAYTELCQMFIEAGEKTGRTFRVIQENIQRRAMEAAGFVDIEERTLKLPIGGWAANPKLAEIGQYCRLVIETDVEGYTTLLWNDVLGRDPAGYQLFLARIRKAVKNKNCHVYAAAKFVWGRKPQGPA